MATSNPIPPAMRARLSRDARAAMAALVAASGDRWPLAAIAERDAAGRPLSWRQSATADDWRAMPADLYAAALRFAMRAARRGREAGTLRFRDAHAGEGLPALREYEEKPETGAVPMPAIHWLEDGESAMDAVAEVWSHYSRERAPQAPLGFLRAIASRIAQRRAQHRIRMRSGLTPAATDRAMPADDLASSAAELAALAAPRLAAIAACKIREGSNAERIRAQKRAAAGRDAMPALSPAELAALEARNARADATDVPWQEAERLSAIAERETELAAMRDAMRKRRARR